MGMFGSLFGAPKKKKNPWEYDPTMAAQEAAWGFPAKAEPEKPKPTSWQDGGKFTGKDALAMALAGIGDAFTREGGGEGNAMATMMGRATSARDAARKAQIKAQTDAAAREASIQRMAAARKDLNPAQLEALAYGDLTPDQVMPKQPDAPAFVKNLAAWNEMTPEQQQQVAAMQAVLNPTFGQGADGIRRPDAPVMGTPVGTVEDGYQFMGGDETDERNWKKVGGAGPAAPRPFR